MVLSRSFKQNLGKKIEFLVVQPLYVQSYPFLIHQIPAWASLPLYCYNIQRD